MSFIAPDAVCDMSPIDRNYRTPTARARLALGCRRRITAPVAGELAA
jgi:hypothetical protein